MMNEIGIPIIDELKLCYEADLTLLDELEAIDYGQSIELGEYSFYRTTSHHFKYAYDVVVEDGDGSEKVATARFGRYGEESVSGYFFYRVENHVLYDNCKLDYALAIPEELGLSFHNFTSLDIAIDSKIDVARLVKRMWHRTDVTTIINGKAVRDRKAVLKPLRLVYSTSLDRLKGLTVYVKQSKAIRNKTKGITVQAYNKKQEIAESSHKEYINEFYGNPKRLYRLEVHLNNEEIKAYCRLLNIQQDLSMLKDRSLLTNMFYYHLSSVIRFTKGRKKLSWKDIIDCNGRL